MGACSLGTASAGLQAFVGMEACQRMMSARLAGSAETDGSGTRQMRTCAGAGAGAGGTAPYSCGSSIDSNSASRASGPDAAAASRTSWRVRCGANSRMKSYM